MKFKATLVDADLLVGIFEEAVRPLARNVLMTLTPECLHLGIPHEFAESARLWVELPMMALADCETDGAFACESKSDNHIPLLVNVNNIITAVRTITSVSSLVRIRLAKRDLMACLTLEGHSEQHHLVQHVPVAVKSMEIFLQTAEPDLVQPPVKLKLPDAKKLAKILDRFRRLHIDVVHVRTDASGALVLSGNHDLVSMQTHFGRLALDPPAFDAHGQPIATSGRVACRQLLHALQYSKSIAPLCAQIVCIVPDAAVVLFVKLESNRGILTWYVPLLAE